MHTELDALSARLQQLEQAHTTLRADNAALRSEVHAEREQNRRARRRLRVQAGLAFVALVGAIFLSPANRQVIAQAQGAVFPAIFARLTALEAKTQYVSVSGGEMYVKGTNLHIENGLPNPGTDSIGVPLSPTLNGKGNLIVGYNTPHSGVFGTGDTRTGSHNLIVGDLNDYGSHGGIVAGLNNSLVGRYATITGGQTCIAYGFAATVTGGVFNVADGSFSAVSGGIGVSQSASTGWSGGAYHTP